MELLAEQERESVQLIVADPPYHNVLSAGWDRQWKGEDDYLSWSERWIHLSGQILKAGGLLFVFGQPGKREHAFIHLMSRASRILQFHDLVVWDRVVGYNERGDSFTPGYELALVLRKGNHAKFRKDRWRTPYPEKTIEKYLRDKRYKNPEARRAHLEKGKYATNIVSIPSLKGSSSEKCGHPSQKPLKLIRNIILVGSDPGDTVLDPFLGSGTTAVAAIETERRWIGFENNPQYVDIASKRIGQAEDAKWGRENE